MGSVEEFTTSGGRRVYSITVPVFEGFLGNVYLVDDGDRPLLVDCGSGLPPSNQALRNGFGEIGETFSRTIAPSDLGAILITHGHIDHFGGLPFLRTLCEAPIAVHGLDRAVLERHEERVVVASRRLETFLESAGVEGKNRSRLMSVYLWGKGRYQSGPTQIPLEEGRTAPGDLEVLHVPGHCPGQVCLRIDDILLTADHVLSRTTPHQAPESITANTGLGHYLDSLTKIESLPGIRLALGGHEKPMFDLVGRIAAIKRSHQRRLEKTLELCREPLSISAVSHHLFGTVKSYHVLLALEEAGAHVEYLYQRGELGVGNLEEIEGQQNPVIRYVKV